MGQAAKVGEWSVTVSNVQILDTIADGYGKFTPESGNKFLLITMTTSNDGKKADSFLHLFLEETIRMPKKYMVTDTNSARLICWDTADP